MEKPRTSFQAKVSLAHKLARKEGFLGKAQAWLVNELKLI
jgi:hypothetical protein